MVINISGKLPASFERECRTGHALLKELEGKYASFEAREKLCAEHAATMRGHRSIDGLGKCVSSIPAWEWHRLVQERGIAEVQSREFQQHLNKTHPELCPNRA